MRCVCVCVWEGGHNTLSVAARAIMWCEVLCGARYCMVRLTYGATWDGAQARQDVAPGEGEYLQVDGPVRFEW